MNRKPAIVSLVASSLTIIALSLSPAAVAEDAKYMGVGSCSSSNCHGGQAPRTGNDILQNEFTTWYKHDKHAKAYQVLGGKESKRIAYHLGIKDPQKDPTCLNCHATYTSSVETQGSSFQMEDGVGCESCHGAAENWLGSHTARSASHEDNINNGMRDLNPLDSRTKLCLSCHLGTDDKFVSHRIMGAGHPRLSFELDTFTATEPAHWKVDDDYVKRKGAYVSARAWLVGQVVQASETLAAIQSEKRSKNGLMPELTLFSCFSCHHSLADNQYLSHEYGGAPGELKLNISSPVLVKAAMTAIDSGMADKIGAELDGIHKSYAAGEGAGKVKALKDIFDGAAKSTAASFDLNDGSLRKILTALAAFGADAPPMHYEDAEQVAMGMSAVLASMKKAPAGANKGMKRVYEALKTPKNFVGLEFTKACKEFKLSA